MGGNPHLKRIVKKNHVLGHLVQSITQHHRAFTELHCYLSNLSNRAIYKSLSVCPSLTRSCVSESHRDAFSQEPSCIPISSCMHLHPFAINMLRLIKTSSSLVPVPISIISSSHWTKLQQADVEDQQGIHAQGRQVAMEGVPDQHLGGFWGKRWGQAR